MSLSASNLSLSLTEMPVSPGILKNTYHDCPRMVVFNQAKKFVRLIK
jgi:hypothetical protein